MANIYVSGSTTYEMTVKVDGFPVPYTPIDFNFDGISAAASGVGLNVAKSLHTLGDSVEFFSIIGRDLPGRMIQQTIAEVGFGSAGVLPILEKTAQACILYDDSGERKIILDLKKVQEMEYPLDERRVPWGKIDLGVACNTNYSRGWMRAFKAHGIPVATDVHVIADIEDDYNREFMTYADILFFSNEMILGQEEAFLKEMVKAYSAKVMVVGMGEQGALLFVREADRIRHYPAVYTRAVVNSIGAGDALCSSFLHFYLKFGDPFLACENAVIYASYKIGEDGAANGFLSEARFDALKRSL